MLLYITHTKEPHAKLNMSIHISNGETALSLDGTLQL